MVIYKTCKSPYCKSLFIKFISVAIVLKSENNSYTCKLRL